MPRIQNKVNFGDTTTLRGDIGEQTVCRVSVSDLIDRMVGDEKLADELRRLADPLQWTVNVRPLPTVFAGADVDTKNAYVMLRIIYGHGGASHQRDVAATATNKTTVVASSIEVRARFVDRFGKTIAPGVLSADTHAEVTVSICPGTDPEAEPQLMWTPTQALGFAGAAQIPNGNAAAVNALLNQQKLRRFHVWQEPAAGAVVLYAQLFDKATAPVALDVPLWSRPLPAGTANERDYDFGPQGVVFAKKGWLALSTNPIALAFLLDAGSWFYDTQVYRLDSGDGTR